MKRLNPFAKRGDILRITRGHGARSVRLFGSFSRGNATKSSDVDLLIELNEGGTLLDIVAMKQDLEDLLGRPVHIVTPGSLSPYLREDVLSYCFFENF